MGKAHAHGFDEGSGGARRELDELTEEGTGIRE